MPTTDTGKAIAARNATTHGLFARDVVLPHLGEDPAGYQTLADELAKQLAPQNLVEHHYVEKIAAASWRLRRLQRWQAQLYEDDTLTEDERLDRLDKTLRHETALHRQIDTAVKLLAKDVPQLYARRIRARVLEDAMLSERECQECPEDDAAISMEVRNRLGRIRKATDLALPRLVAAPLDTLPRDETQEAHENCDNELTPAPALPSELLLPQNWGPGGDLSGSAPSGSAPSGSAPSGSSVYCSSVYCSPELGRGASAPTPKIAKTNPAPMTPMLSSKSTRAPTPLSSEGTKCAASTRTPPPCCAARTTASSTPPPAPSPIGMPATPKSRISRRGSRTTEGHMLTF